MNKLTKIASTTPKGVTDVGGDYPVSSSANTSFWQQGGSVALDLGGYSFDFSAPDTTAKDDASTAPASTAPATTTTKKTAGEWIAANPLAVGVAGVGVLALIAIMASGRK